MLRKRTSATSIEAAKKWRFGEESNPQRLKPNSLHSSYVRPKGRTLQRSEFFRSLFKPSSARVVYGTVENVVFITLSEPQAHGDTAEAVPFVEIRDTPWKRHD
jgi:hypothetical protein